MAKSFAPIAAEIRKLRRGLIDIELALKSLRRINTASPLSLPLAERARIFAKTIIRRAAARAELAEAALKRSPDYVPFSAAAALRRARHQHADLRGFVRRANPSGFATLDTTIEQLALPTITRATIQLSQALANRRTAANRAAREARRAALRCA